MMEEKHITSEKEKGLLRSLFFRSLTVFASGNAGNHGANGFAYTLLPFLNHFYKDDEEKLRESLERNVVWYNTTQNVGTFVMSLIASMEKENSKNPDFDKDSINSVKASLMGPLSGIGDTLFWGILRIIASGIAITLGMQGNVLAPVIFLLVYNVPSLITRWYLTKLGYSVGTLFIEDIHSSGLMDVLTKAANTLGLIMLGGMTSGLVQFQTILEWDVGGGETIVLQEMLDQVLVGLVPLSVTLLCFYLLSKKNMNFTVLVILVMILGMALSFLGIA